MGRLNKPAQDGYTYRSPGQTNANDMTPNMREDVIRSQRADIDRMERGRNPTATRAYNRQMQEEAGLRALSRTASRAGLAGAALQGGYALGREIDKATGVGKKLVDESGIGDAVDKVAAGKDRVKLSDYARRRQDEEDDKSIAADLDALDKEKSDAAAADRAKSSATDDSMPNTFAKGGKIRGDGLAQRGRTKGRFV